MKSRYKNSKKSKQIKQVASNLSKELMQEFSKMAKKSKFNFSYLDATQKDTSGFNHFSKEELKDFISKIKSFSEKSLEELKQDETLMIYGSFPTKTNLKPPKFIPLNVEWGRFRLTG